MPGRRATATTASGCMGCYLWQQHPSQEPTGAPRVQVRRSTPCEQTRTLGLTPCNCYLTSWRRLPMTTDLAQATCAQSCNTPHWQQVHALCRTVLLVLQLGSLLTQSRSFEAWQIWVVPCCANSRYWAFSGFLWCRFVNA